MYRFDGFAFMANGALIVGNSIGAGRPPVVSTTQPGVRYIPGLLIQIELALRVAQFLVGTISIKNSSKPPGTGK